jgi:hypothetical protein
LSLGYDWNCTWDSDILFNKIIYIGEIMIAWSIKLNGTGSLPLDANILQTKTDIQTAITDVVDSAIVNISISVLESVIAFKINSSGVVENNPNLDLICDNIFSNLSLILDETNISFTINGYKSYIEDQIITE